MNEVVIDRPDLDGSVGGALTVRFETFTPYLSTFLVRHDGGAWVEHEAGQVEGHRATGSLPWPLHPGRNVLEIRSRNVSGRLGPVALIEIASPPHVAPPSSGRWTVADGGSDLGGFAVHAGRLYVPRQWSNRVDVVCDGDVQSTIGTPIPQPPQPLGPPIEPLNEPANLRRAANAPAGHILSPIACAVGPDGTLYVADAENYRIQPFDPSGDALEPWGEHGIEDTQFLHLRAIAVGEDGSVYVADSGYVGPVGLRTEHVSRVRRFDASGALIRLIVRSDEAPGPSSGGVCSPAGLTTDATGMLWVADSGNHRILCFSPDGVPQACWGTLGDGWGQLRYPTDVAVTRDGFVFVADPQHHCVWKFTAAGEALATLDRGDDGAPLLRPGRLAADAKSLFVGDVTAGIIHQYDHQEHDS